MKIYEQIKKAMEGANVAQVHEATGINKTTLHNIKNGSHANPRLNTLQSLADYFKLNNS